jgi:hypothetical protein
VPVLSLQLKVSKSGWRRNIRIVVFVHGLLGDSVSTCWRFQRLIDEQADSRDFWNHCHLYFYRYNSFGHAVPELSEWLRDFLQLIFPSPSGGIFELAVLPEIRQLGP